MLKQLKEHLSENAPGWLVTALATATVFIITWGFPDAWDRFAIWATTTLPTRALFSLLCLSILLNLVLLAFLLPKLGEERRTLLGGIYWDKKKNPYCPSCKTPVAKYGEFNYGDHGYYCSVCKDVFVLADASGKPITPAEAQSRL